MATAPAGSPCVSAKEYKITPQYSGGRKVVFKTPQGWRQGAVAPSGDEIIFRPLSIMWLPQLSITVKHLYGKNPSDPQHYAEGFVSFIDAVPKAMGQKDSPKPELTKFESFDTPASGQLSIWCIRSSTYHDYFITEIVDRDIHVEIRLEALDADEIVDKIGGLKALANSVRILNR